jgi:ATP-binding cassette subfamily B protein
VEYGCQLGFIFDDLISHNMSQKKNVSNLINVFVYWKYVGGLMLLTLLINGLKLYLPFIIASSIDSVKMPSFNFESEILKFALTLFLIFVFTILQLNLETFTAEKVAFDLRKELVFRISTKSYDALSTQSPATLQSNFTNDIDSIKNYLSKEIITVLASFVIVIGASFILLRINWKLGLIFGVVLPLIGIIFFFFRGKIGGLLNKYRKVIDYMSNIVNESIVGASLIRVLNAQTFELDKFSSANNEAKAFGFNIAHSLAILSPTLILLTNLITAAILIMGGSYVINNTISLGNFVAFNSYLSLSLGPIMALGLMSNLFADLKCSIDRLNKIGQVENTDIITKQSGDVGGNIEIQSAGLKRVDQTIFENISFKIKAGSKVAIMGPTGSGKTQLIHTMINLLKLSSGSIEFGGQNVGNIDPEYFYKQVSIVYQEHIIFNTSILENIVFDKIIENEILERAIRAAEVHEFAVKLSHGLATLVAERGANLSGGQRQRIMLARALVTNPKILILDNFLSHIDIKTAALIVDNLKIFYPELTVILVTQNVALVKDYDQVYLLNDGNVVCNGTHRELLANPIYQEMCEF